MSDALALADLAAEQWGLVTTSQARGLGMSAQTVARLTNQGALERLTHGVHRVAGTPPSPLDELRAAWLALDPTRRQSERLRDKDPIAVAYRSAAAIHELGDLEADRFEFISGARKQTRRPDIRLHRGQIDPGEWTTVEGLPVTSVLRTVADLAAEHVDGGHLATVVRDALTRRQVDDQQLATALRPYAHHYGVRMGDGEALLSRFLQESGVSVPIGRAVELAGAMPMPGNARDLQRLSEQLASIQSAIAPAARLTEQIVNSPAMKAVADLARRAQSPAMQRLAKQNAEVAEMSRLARTISESINLSDFEPKKQENSE
ncbi:type IV toxin-antitoxin system AbiEi family antitoxin domain-containing protein [Arthrobacter sp. NPDC058127]|uniref:type IV toxin-antitoxin system AbiEi family antitoxin domain-containing protein n=1 Tax=Arthrobacter sp. NPDC058127 TaxID=3346351 RepID=UPI0036EA7022